MLCIFIDSHKRLSTQKRKVPNDLGYKQYYNEKNIRSCVDPVTLDMKVNVIQTPSSAVYSETGFKALANN